MEIDVDRRSMWSVDTLSKNARSYGRTRYPNTCHQSSESCCVLKLMLNEVLYERLPAQILCPPAYSWFPTTRLIYTWYVYTSIYTYVNYIVDMGTITKRNEKC